jgi:phosphoglycerol transferase MdoB-like AlkP superfamily enzyme
VADHSHPSPREFEHYKVPEYREIPFLIYGEPLKKEYRGKKNNRLMSQYDIPATLLGQLGMEYKQFKWSNNAMNPYAKEYVYYGFDDGLGFMTPDSNYFVYQAWEKDSPNKGYKNIHFDSKAKQDSIMKLGESYLQQLYQDYLDY